MSSDPLRALRVRILPWYAVNKRDLPWRRTTDPVGLVAAELMLQQTGVERVAARWPDFVRRFPSWESLASAPLADVIREWRGLGYNRRAVNLHRIAQAVVSEHGGALPTERSALLKLPGVGPYTASAILSFIHGQDEPAIDVNLRRVIGRAAFGDERAAATDIESAARDALPRGRSSGWNQALMDFAALQCTLRRPACLLCPIRDACRYAARVATVERAAGSQLSNGHATKSVAAPRAPRRRLAAERRAPYVGSTRYFRGRIVDLLRHLGERQTLGAAELAERLSPDDPEGRADITMLVNGLVRDGLVAQHGHNTEPRFSLA